MPRWKGCNRVAAVVLTAGALASVGNAAEPAASPLNRLKQRSASERWEERRSDLGGWAGVEDAATRPQPDSGDIPLPPAIRKAVPSPYFEDAAEPLIAFPAPAQPAAAPTPSPSLNSNVSEFLVPPAPGEALRTAQLEPVPEQPNPEDADYNVFRPITQIKPYYDYSPTGKKPYEYLCPQPKSIPESERFACPPFETLPQQGQLQRQWGELHYCWEASNLHHKPLYFEDVPLERYGHTFCEPIQPFVSVGKFGVQFLALPYTMALDPAWRDQYALGYYQPGDPAPHLIYTPPLNLKAATSAVGTYTGLFFLFP